MAAVEKRKRPIESSFSNKWALISLGLTIFAVYALQVHAWRPSNTETLDVSQVEVICKQKRDTFWYSVNLNTKSGKSLFISEKYRIEDCEALRTKFFSEADSALVLKPNGLVLKVFAQNTLLYEAERAYFSMILFAVLIWAPVAYIIAGFLRKKTQKISVK